MSGLHRVHASAWAALAALCVVAPAAAQSVRVSGATTMRYIELRPLVRDSVPAALTAGSGLLRQASDGRVVRCIPEEEYCLDVRPGARASTVPVIHDLEASAWGLGEGVRVYAHVRARTGFGNEALWPRGNDAFDVLVAYAELERATLRVRLGRQWQVSGLGFYNFDGAAVALRPVDGLTIEAYGGRSLLRGLNETRSSGALASIEPLAPPSSGVLLGVHARFRQAARLALGAGYHVELRTDGGGRYGELAVADASVRLGGVSIDGGVEADVASAALNEARLRVRSAPLGRFVLTAEARRYRPYFELWTIWGAFSPVGFDEARGGAVWTPAAALLVRAEGSWRRYEPIDDYEGLAALRATGWGVEVAVGWRPAPAWQTDAAYRLEVAAGAARRDASAALTRRLGDVATLSLHGVVFQRVYEFRLDESTVAGAGLEASVRLAERARVVASATAYRHVGAGRTDALDWTQRRAMLRLEWTAGSEPALRPRTGGAP